VFTYLIRLIYDLSFDCDSKFATVGVQHAQEEALVLFVGSWSEEWVLVAMNFHGDLKVQEQKRRWHL